MNNYFSLIGIISSLMIVCANGAQMDLLNNEFNLSDEVVPVPVPSSLTFSYSNTYLLHFLQDKYNISSFNLDALRSISLGMYSSILCCQFSKAPQFARVPFEILLKIFSYSVDADYNKDICFFLDEKSGKELMNFHVDFPGICILKPRRDHFIIDFSKYTQKYLADDQLALIREFIQHKLLQHNFCNITDMASYYADQTKVQPTENPLIYKMYVSFYEKKLSSASVMPMFPLLNKIYNNDGSKTSVRSTLFFFDGDCRYKLVEQMPLKDTHSIAIYNDNGKLIFQKYLDTLTDEESLCTHKKPSIFSLARYHVVTCYNGCIILYDEKKGMFVCIPFKELKNIIIRNNLPFVCKDPIIGQETDDCRNMLYSFEIGDHFYEYPW